MNQTTMTRHAKKNKFRYWKVGLWKEDELAAELEKANLNKLAITKMKKKDANCMSLGGRKEETRK